MSAVAIGGALQDLEAEQQAIFDAAAPSVVFVSNGSSFGSGFVIQSDGLLLTNAHVVDGKSTVDVVLLDGRTLTGTVEQVADRLDLATVRVEADGLPPLSLISDPADARVGTWLGAVGHGRGGIWTFNTGMLSNRYEDDGVTVYQTQIPLNPGSSGGPILDRHGRVVGVVTAGIEGANSINFAIPAFEAVLAIEALEGQCACLTIEAPAGAPIFVDGAMVGSGPLLRFPVGPGDYTIFSIINGQKITADASWPDNPQATLAAP